MVFDLFDTTDYIFLQLESGKGGNKVVTEYPANGIFKLRSGMVQADNVESFDADATLHIRPTEPFVGNLVGNGVRVENIDYRIDGATEGKDFDTGDVEFYRVTLKREKIWDESDLPLV